MLTERLLSFNWQRFTLHKNEKKKSWIVQKNTEFYELIELLVPLPGQIQQTRNGCFSYFFPGNRRFRRQFLWNVNAYFLEKKKIRKLGPVVQSVVSLTSSLRVISLTVLADSIYNIMIFFAEKMWVAFALQKLLTFFQQKISAYLRITRSKF